MTSPLPDDLPEPMRRALARTEELCAHDRLMHNTRTLLLDIERMAAQAFENHRLHQHPDRQELRIVYFSPRDGMRWSVIRYQGQSPLVLLGRPEDEMQNAGGVPNALARMTNAVVGNPVPIPPVERPNPLFRRPPL